MPWWIWVLGGMGLLVVEIMTPGGFFFLFFGIAALLTGAVAGLELVDPLWAQWLIFSGLSVVTLLLFRSKLVDMLNGKKPKTPAMADIQGEIAVILEDIEPGAVGKAELRGVPWKTTNLGSSTVTKGQRCKVAKVEGLMLFVRCD